MFSLDGSLARWMCEIPDLKPSAALQDYLYSSPLIDLMIAVGISDRKWMDGFKRHCNYSVIADFNLKHHSNTFCSKSV